MPHPLRQEIACKKLQRSRDDCCYATLLWILPCSGHFPRKPGGLKFITKPQCPTLCPSQIVAICGHLRETLCMPYTPMPTRINRARPPPWLRRAPLANPLVQKQIAEKLQSGATNQTRHGFGGLLWRTLSPGNRLRGEATKRSPGSDAPVGIRGVLHPLARKPIRKKLQSGANQCLL